jgi:hypothetical protein
MSYRCHSSLPEISAPVRTKRKKVAFKAYSNHLGSISEDTGNQPDLVREQDSRGWKGKNRHFPVGKTCCSAKLHSLPLNSSS